MRKLSRRNVADDNTTTLLMTHQPNAADSTPAIAGSDTALGSIVHSQTQMDYVAQAFRDGEREDPPVRDEYAFGQPVYATETVRGTPYAVIGVVYDTRLVDPDQGRDGPRLSAPDQEMFVPGYVNEKQTMIGIALLGTAEIDADPHRQPDDDGNGEPQSFRTVSQSMPRWTLDIDDFVYALSDDGFRQFHTYDGTLSLEYYERLVATANQFGPEVALAIIDRLRRLTGADAVLDVVEKKVRWQSSESRGVIR